MAKTGSEAALRASLTRRIGFTAEHRYYRDDWSPDENSRVFGSAAKPAFHGHDYLCDVTVSGIVDAPSGMLIDLAALDDVLHREVRDRFDGRRINLDVPEFRDGGMVPSCENLAAFIFEKVQAALGNRVVVESVVVRESDTLSAEVRRA
ncbi:MAG TPA: 6-carboxytetrahydropterin synthase [Gemmatimonadaceae bacterium]|nr:6-carboxytetrahydropterin synthase [Gemmatimonadaceae bacterium]